MCGFQSINVKYIKIKLSINVKILINFLLKNIGNILNLYNI